MSKDNIETMIENARPTLTSEERSAMLRAIEEKVAVAAPVPSPYFAFIYSRTMTTLIIALVLALGTAGTVAASESAKPGDLLFPIERATERVRLALASEVREAELRAQFAEERFIELQEIIDEEATVVTEPTDDTNTDSSRATSTEAIITFEAEADVFTDITTVKVEINDRTARFVTTETTREAVIDEIVERLNVDREIVEVALVFEIEDRASRPSERGIISVDDRGEERISTAVNVFLDYLEEFEDGEKRLALLTAFLDEIDNVSVAGRPPRNTEGKTENSRIRIDDERVEIRDEGFRIRIDDDGEVRVRTENNSGNSGPGSDNSNRDRDRDRDSQDDDDSNSDDSRSSSLNDTSASSFRFEAEADVFTDVTIVKVEINDIKNEFETDADTRDEVIDEIVATYGISRATVAAALDFQIENRASRPTDSSENSTDNSGSGKSDDDDDDDDEEDNSGSGKSDDDDDDDDEDDDEDDDDNKGRGRGGDDD